MNKQEILDAIAKYEKALQSPSFPQTAKAAMQAKLDKAKEDLKKLEEKSDDEMKKLNEEEKKLEDELQAQIQKYEKAISSASFPESAKEPMRKKLKEAKDKLAEMKKEIKEEKKEVAEEKKEIKAAQEKVEKAKSKVRKTPIKKPAKGQPKAKAPKVEKIEVKKETPKSKERKQKSAERKKKVKQTLSDLQELINKNKKLSMYKGKDVDLDRDAKRSAKPSGYRFVGKHDYRDPKKLLTKEEIRKGVKRGIIDYENRPNRSDKYPKGYKGKIKLETGGDIHADGQRIAKPVGLRWKDEAVKDGIIPESSLYKTPSSRMAKLYPEYVYTEARKEKSDKKPSKKYISLGHGGTTEGTTMAKGGKVKRTKKAVKQDKERKAKPSGWRWKDEAASSGVISKGMLAKSPSKYMREKYPDLVYKEERPNRADESRRDKI